MNSIREKVKELSVVFVGPTRDSSGNLTKIFENIERIGGLFKSFSCVFVESDSSDNTLEILKNYKSGRDNIHILSLGKLEDRINSRTCRIATARNVGIEYCEQNNILDTHDYYIHMCVDDVNSEKIEEEDFLSCFKYDISSWEGMTANQLNYYDIWCLRAKGWVENDCWYAIHNRPSYMSYDEAFIMYVGSKFIQIPKNYGLIEVDAAHGGFGIYKSSFAKGSRYRGSSEAGNAEECDLVNFCSDVKKKGGRIFINSELMNMNNVNNRHDTTVQSLRSLGKL